MPLQNGQPPRFFESIFQSCFSTSFYLRVIQRPTGRCLLYLIGLLAIISTVLGVRFSLQLKSNSSRILAEMEAAGLPTVTIRDGVAESDPPDRYTYTDAETKFGIVIDTALDDEGAVALFKETRPTLLLGRRELILRVDASAWQEVDLERVNGQVFDFNTRHTLHRLMTGLSFLLLPVALTIYSLVERVLHALVFAAIAWGVQVVRNRPLPFRGLFHISLYALTLPLLLDFVLTLANTGVPYLFEAVYLIMLWRILWRLVPVSGPTQPQEVSDPPATS